MAEPLKALKYSQLEITKKRTVATSGHEIFDATFSDADGQKKCGFYKPLDSKPVGSIYPSLLAKISTAYSVLMRIASERVAEDRLVLDDAGNIVGTFSYTLPHFKPMACSGETLPSDPAEQELLCPSWMTLILHNVAEILVSSWRSKDDDAHPGNVSLFGLIDHDMRGYNLTSFVKGFRYSDGVFKELPQKALTLKGSDIDDFPNFGGRTHSPANTIPGNLNMGKRYMSYDQFQVLAKNPHVETAEGTVYFHDQLFYALLNELVTYDPALLRARLTDHFGDMPLDYLSLNETRREQLSQAFPKIFNVQNDSKPFVDVILNFFQDEYDEFYRATVYKPPCKKNSSGVAVTGFSQYLRNKPSSFRNIKTELEKRNTQMTERWVAHEQRQAEALVAEPVLNVDNTARSASANPPLDAHCVRAEGRFDLDSVHQRYHQIWRDAHINQLNEVLSLVHKLSDKLVKELRDNPVDLSLPNKVPMSVEDENLTQAWQLINSGFIDNDEPLLNCDRNNSMRTGLTSLREFSKKLIKCSEKYYCSSSTNPVRDNAVFCNGIAKIIQEHENINAHLGPTPSGAAFNKIITDLQQFNGDINFERHLIDKDVESSRVIKYDHPQELARNHTQKEVIKTAIATLFEWAKKVDKETLNKEIFDIIRDHYAPSKINFLAQRKRGEYVKTYLNTSTESGDNKLAYILSTGNKTSSSLNTLLIKHLMPVVLKDTIGMVNINLTCVTQACEKGEFNVGIYTEYAINYGKSDRFNHIYSACGVARFNNAMYAWVETISRENFQQLITVILKEYEPYSFNFLSNKTRGNEVRGYFKKEPLLSNDAILTAIFKNGDTTSTSLNTLLFNSLWRTMQTKIMSTDANLYSEFKWLSELDPDNETYRGLLLASLKMYAEQRSGPSGPTVKKAIHSPVAAAGF